MDKAEAIKILKDFHDESAFFSVRTALETLHPELKEPEDERIRKELIEHVKDQQSSFISAPDCRDKYEEEENNKYNSWLAWLEKKGNQNHIEQNLEMVEALRTEYEKGRADAIAEMRKEWSEEDEVKLQACIDCLQAESLMGKVDTAMTNWLKSLKERYTWKPSDEQMHAFEQVYDWYNNNFAPSETLNSLYNNLKKLKGE